MKKRISGSGFTRQIFYGLTAVSIAAISTVSHAAKVHTGTPEMIKIAQWASLLAEQGNDCDLFYKEFDDYKQQNGLVKAIDHFSTKWTKEWLDGNVPEQQRLQRKQDIFKIYDLLYTNLNYAPTLTERYKNAELWKEKVTSCSAGMFPWQEHTFDGDPECLFDEYVQKNGLVKAIDHFSSEWTKKWLDDMSTPRRLQDLFKIYDLLCTSYTPTLTERYNNAELWKKKVTSYSREKSYGRFIFPWWEHTFDKDAKCLFDKYVQRNELVKAIDHFSSEWTKEWLDGNVSVQEKLQRKQDIFKIYDLLYTNCDYAPTLTERYRNAELWKKKVTICSAGIFPWQEYTLNKDAECLFDEYVQKNGLVKAINHFSSEWTKEWLDGNVPEQQRLQRKQDIFKKYLELYLNHDYESSDIVRKMYAENWRAKVADVTGKRFPWVEVVDFVDQYVEFDIERKWAGDLRATSRLATRWACLWMELPVGSQIRQQKAQYIQNGLEIMKVYDSKNKFPTKARATLYYNTVLEVTDNKFPFVAQPPNDDNDNVSWEYGRYLATICFDAATPNALRLEALRIMRHFSADHGNTQCRFWCGVTSVTGDYPPEIWHEKRKNSLL